MKMIKCRTIFQGKGTGKALVSNVPISFFGGVDPNTGVIIERGHPLFGKSIKGKVLIFPTGKGSTVGSYILLQLSKNGKSPAAIVCKEAEAIVAVGAIIGEIPMVDNPDVFDFTNGQQITVDGFNDAIVID